MHWCDVCKSECVYVFVKIRKLSLRKSMWMPNQNIGCACAEKETKFLKVHINTLCVCVCVCFKCVCVFLQVCEGEGNRFQFKMIGKLKFCAVKIQPDSLHPCRC